MLAPFAASVATLTAAALLVALPLLAAPAIAQGPTPMADPLTYEECIRKQRELRAEAKTAGDQAWEIVKQLTTRGFVKNAESEALYRRARDLRDMAMQLRCMWRPPNPDASAANQNEQYRAINVATGLLARGATMQFSMPIRTIIRNQLKQVRSHNSTLMQKVAQVERDVAAATAQPHQSILEAGTYTGRLSGTTSMSRWTKSDHDVVVNADLTYTIGATAEQKRANRGQLTRMGRDTLSFEDALAKCPYRGQMRFSEDRRTLEMTMWFSANSDCDPGSARGVYVRR